MMAARDPIDTSFDGRDGDHRPTVATIRAACTPEKWEFVSKSLYSWGMRHVSFYLAWVFLKAGISADQTTYLALVVGLVGCLFLVTGDYISMLIGAILINLWYLLDCVNGNIARYQGIVNKFGEFIDDTGAYFMFAFVFTGLGIGLYRKPDHSLHLLVNMIFPNFLPSLDKGVFLIAGSLASLALTLQTAIHGKLNLLFRVTERRNVPRLRERGQFSRLLYLLYHNMTSFSGLVLPLLMVVIVIRTSGIFIIFYSLFYLFALGATYVRSILSAKKTSPVVR